jgi:hypothetical protein
MSSSGARCSPARIDNTIRVFASAGNAGGLAKTIRFLRVGAVIGSLAAHDRAIVNDRGPDGDLS